MWCMTAYAMEYYSHKRKEILPTHDNTIDLEGSILSDVSQKKTDTYLTDMWNLKIKTKTHRYGKQIDGSLRRGIQRGQNGKGVKRYEVKDVMYSLVS